MLIGGTILVCCSLVVLGCWTSRSFFTVGFFPTAEDKTAYSTGALVASSATWVVSVNCFSPSGDTSRKTDGLLVEHNSLHSSFILLQTFWSNSSLTVCFRYKAFTAYPYCPKASCLMALRSVSSLGMRLLLPLV